MTFIQDGITGSVLASVDDTHKALRVGARPLEVLGFFSLSLTSGVIAAALTANSEIVQFRNSTSTLVVPLRVRVSAAVSTTMFAAGVPMQLDMLRAISWSGQGTGGGAATIGSGNKRRTSLANSVMVAGDIRVASTGALGAGTKTLDANARGCIIAACPITGSLNGQIIAPGTPLYEAQLGDGHYPDVLVQNEGFVIRCVAVPATGTWQFTTTIEWAEVAAF